MSAVQVLVEENTPLAQLKASLPRCPACNTNAGTVPVTIGQVEYLVCVPCQIRKLG